MLYTINELPFNDRVKKENILVGGIWYASSHPNMLLYIPPQLESMNHFTESGVVINDCVTINDLPAKACVLDLINLMAVIVEQNVYKRVKILKQIKVLESLPMN